MENVWNMALKDPHLMRLGDFLVQKDGREDMGKLELEEAYLRDPWMNWLTIVKVVDPEYQAKPFVKILNNQAQDHSCCPFFKHCNGVQKYNTTGAFNQDGKYMEHGTQGSSSGAI